MKAGLLCRKAAALFFVLVLILGISVLAYATNDEIEYVQSLKEEDEQRLVSTEERIAALEESKSNSESYLTELSSQISELTEDLADTNSRLAEKENQLADIEEEIATLENEAAEQYEDMKIRIQYLYENGAAAGTFVSMLSAESFSEFLNRAENYSALNKFDREMLQNYESTLSAIQVRQDKLLAEKEEILTIREELSQRQAQIQSIYEATYNDMVAFIAELDGAEAEYYAIIDELQEKEALMNELLRQQYEAEAAAALAEQQAAEEAAARAAAEAEAAAQENSYEEPQEEPGVPSVPEEQPAPQEPSEDNQGEQENSPAEEHSEDAGTPQEETQESQPEEEQSSEEAAGDMKLLGNFMITAYCPCARCCGAYATGYTASGTLATEGVTVAMGGVDFGTKLCINGHIYTVEDRGTAYGHVDIFFSSHESALAFGLKYADVYVVN